MLGAPASDRTLADVLTLGTLAFALSLSISFLPGRLAGSGPIGKEITMFLPPLSARGQVPGPGHIGTYSCGDSTTCRTMLDQDSLR